MTIEKHQMLVTCTSPILATVEEAAISIFIN